MNKSKSKNYLLKKLDVLENSMITAHNKDYERVMADIGYQLTEEEKLKKKKRLQKINSYKEKRKLRQMSELRESYLQERISKVLEKQKKNNSICIKRTLPPIKYIADDVIKRKNEEEKEYLFSGCIERRWLVKISQAMAGKVVLEFCTGSRKAVCSVQRVLQLSRTQIPGFA